MDRLDYSRLYVCYIVRLLLNRGTTRESGCCTIQLNDLLLYLSSAMLPRGVCVCVCVVTPNQLTRQSCEFRSLFFMFIDSIYVWSLEKRIVWDELGPCRRDDFFVDQPQHLAS